jgi:hypothetical protein
MLAEDNSFCSIKQTEYNLPFTSSGAPELLLALMCTTLFTLLNRRLQIESKTLN